MKHWNPSKQELEGLKAKGMIRGAVIKKQPKISKEKIWIEETLKAFCEDRCHWWQLHKEYRFHYLRKWKFDFLLKKIILSKQMIAIEYEGLFSAKSRHTTVKGFSGDT